MKLLSIAVGVFLTGLVGTGAVASPALVSPVQYQNRAAFRLSDGITEAIVVPSLGRVMRYGFVGGRNWLWNSTAKDGDPGSFSGWHNWGGEKTWLAPQSEWPVWHSPGWPPDPAIDGTPYTAVLLPGGRLRTTGNVSSGTGCRIVRDYSFDPDGSFAVAQMVEKITGPPLHVSIWSVTQVDPPATILLSLNPDSPYRDNWFTFAGQPVATVFPARPQAMLLEIRPSSHGNYKVGADSPVAVIVAVQDGIALRLRAAKPSGDYPDGAGSHGFPTEVYDSGTTQSHYVELELLSPFRIYVPGSRFTTTVHWSLHKLTAGDPDAAARLLTAP